MSGTSALLGEGRRVWGPHCHQGSRLSRSVCPRCCNDLGHTGHPRLKADVLLESWPIQAMGAQHEHLQLDVSVCACSAGHAERAAEVPAPQCHLEATPPSTTSAADDSLAPRQCQSHQLGAEMASPVPADGASWRQHPPAWPVKESIFQSP